MRRGVPQNGECVRVVLVSRGENLDRPTILERQPEILDPPVGAHENRVLGELGPDRPGSVKPRCAVRKFEFRVVREKDLHDGTG